MADISNQTSRAEKFDDEKRRIIESCFSKTEPNGQLIESYITHIRVQEDAQFPSSPPPPDSPSDNKKPRVVIISVRSTGRVRMHKARENNNGSFSIGKTWNMEELSAIESFSSTSAPPKSEKEAQWRAWAGTLGFVVTITKPYYWQAGTAKEKEFFIASTVKIYRKYTKGQMPEPRGFDEQQKQAVLGIPMAPPSGQRPPPSQQPPREMSPAPPAPPFAQRSQSREGSAYRGSPGPPPSVSDRERSEMRSPSLGGMAPPTRPFARNEPTRSSSRERSAPDAYRSASGQQPPQLAEPPIIPAARSASSQRSQSPAGSARSRSRPARAVPGAFPSDADSQTSQQLNVAPKLPPLQTSNFSPPDVQSRTATMTSKNAESGKSSAMDPGDAATFSAMHGFQPAHSIARDVQDAEAISPGTMDSPSMEELRPAPLSQRYRPTNGDRPSTPGEASGAAGPPEINEPPPLSPARSNRRPSAQTPDTTQPSRSPLSNSMTTPQEEHKSSDITPAVSTEEHRPGLGPMIKNKAAADRFRKAATAATAFRPRPGGAAEKILKAKAEREAKGGSSEPDGITGVVPAPLKPQPKAALTPEAGSRSASGIGTPDEGFQTPREGSLSPQKKLRSPEKTARRSASRGSSPTKSVTEASQTQNETDAPRQQQAARQAQVQNRKRDALQEQYLRELDIDKTLLSEQSVDFENLLYDFGWRDAALSPKGLAAMEVELRREHGKLEAGSWLSGTGLQDSVVAREEKERQVAALLDKAIQECDDMEGLLTIYQVELSSLKDDVAFIEAQSQGLQVQSANQQLLHAELTSLVETLSIDRRELKRLDDAVLKATGPKDLSDFEYLEITAAKLYKALVTIDPAVRPSHAVRRNTQNGIMEGDELASMAAVIAKRAEYRRFAENFCRQVEASLGSAVEAAKQAIKRDSLNAITSTVDRQAFITNKQPLWAYSPLVLFARDVDGDSWQSIYRNYQASITQMYDGIFDKNINGHKRKYKKPSAAETDVLFTSTHDHDEPSAGPAGALSGAARKLTVKHSQTLTRSLRGGTSNDRSTTSLDTVDRDPNVFGSAQVFSGVMNDIAVLISYEQNFYVDFFHMTSLTNEDFIDAISVAAPGERVGSNLRAFKPTEPDREMANRVHEVMSDTFSSFFTTAAKLIDWLVSEDPIQGAGAMITLNRHAYFLNNTSQEYLGGQMDQLMARVHTLFVKFVDEQIRAIEDTKVKTKKRKGVIGFMRTFPAFSAHVESVVQQSMTPEELAGNAECIAEARSRIDDAYGRINRTMFDSLKIIAKESPGESVPASAKTSADDAEDKEILNYHVLIIDNMNHYIEAVPANEQEDSVLNTWRDRALRERAEASEAYIARVIRRPLGRLLELLESLPSSKSSSTRPLPPRKTARHLLSSYDGREIRRGIETLRKRIEKHFGDAENDEDRNVRLVAMIEKEAERAYLEVLKGLDEGIKQGYGRVEGEKDVKVEFELEDIVAGFKR